MTKIRLFGVLSAGMALLLNQLIENLLMAAKGKAILVPGLLDFTQTWNGGVSFSLFWQDGEVGRYVLIAVLAAIVIGVGVLAWRAGNVATGIGYGLTVGGALGNLVDRSLYGAVFDYLFLHLGSVPLFVCNFSDIAISAGVLLLVAGGFTVTRPGIEARQV